MTWVTDNTEEKHTSVQRLFSLELEEQLWWKGVLKES
jgi:hypothetical protein